MTTSTLYAGTLSDRHLSRYITVYEDTLPWQDGQVRMLARGRLGVLTPRWDGSVRLLLHDGCDETGHLVPRQAVRLRAQHVVDVEDAPPGPGRDHHPLHLAGWERPTEAIVVPRMTAPAGAVLARWQQRRACRAVGGHWWHPATGTLIDWTCCQCGAERDGMPTDGS